MESVYSQAKPDIISNVSKANQMTATSSKSQIKTKAFAGRRSLRTILIIPFVIQMIAIVALIGWLSFENGKQAVNDLASKLRSEVTSRIAQHSQEYFRTPQLFQKINKKLIESGELDLDNIAQLQQHFWQQIQVDQAIDYLFYGDAQGRFIGVQNLEQHTVAKIRDLDTDGKRHIYRLDDQGQQIEWQKEKTKAYDPRQRPWYQSAVMAGKATWSPVYPSAHLNVLQVTPVQPIYHYKNNEKVLQGVLAINLRLSEINQFLAELDISQRGEAFIIERNGDLIASSTKEQPSRTNYDPKTGKDKRQRLNAQGSQEPLIRQTAMYLQQYFSDYKHIQTREQLRYEYQGEDQLIEVMPINNEQGLDWLIVVVIPENDVMARINDNTRTTILLCIVALIVALLVGVLTARWLINPIKELEQAAERLSLGNWAENVPAKRQDELGSLALSFNRMAAALRDSFKNLEKKNADLEEMDKLKNEFLANTSHELRTPLNGIIGIADSLIDGATGELPEETAYNLQMIIASGTRLTNLVNDILDFSQLRHKAIQLQLKPVALKEMAEVVLTFSKPLLDNKPIELINQVNADLPAVLADENRLQQILHNLVGNAIKFTAKGQIHIKAERKKEGVLIQVSDTGIGIAKEKQNRIFESFKQADGSTAREYGGTGLGLSISRQLIELHKGYIGIESDLGKGSVFSFWLPAAKQAAETLAEPLVSKPHANDIDALKNAPKKRKATSVSLDITAQELNELRQSGRFTILIVDDEPVNLQVLSNHLANKNYILAEASNGVDAWGAISNGFRPDLILLDVMMPKMTGYEVCRRVRELYMPNEMPILLLTAKNQVTDLVEGLESGANDYLTKPISKSELLTRIKVHIQLYNINQAYGRFVPHEFLQLLSKNSVLDVELGDHVEQEMTVLFTDIRGFTSLSEKMTPKDNFRFINGYLSRMEPMISTYHGFIDKYIGDAIMALFPTSADDAVQGAIAMLNTLSDYNEGRKRAKYEPIAIGIGLNTGPLMLGTVGGQNRMDGTVIADAVNLASRVEGLTKVYGAALLITEQTYLRLQDRSHYLIRIIDRVKVKGKSQPVTIYEVFDADTAEQSQLKQQTLQYFEQGVAHFHREEIGTARDYFEQVLAQNPADLAAKVYLERCQKNKIQRVLV